jgi:sec-independent protein translocase protein TatC
MERDAQSAPLVAPLMAHLAELRGRLLLAAGAWLAASAVALLFAQPLYAALTAPLAAASPDGPGLIYTAPAEVLVTYLRLALWAGAFVGLPALLIQIWLFVAPGLTPAERRAARPLLAAAPALFAGGAALVYWVVLPAVLPFFAGFAQADAPAPIAMTLRVAAYLDFVLTLTLAFGLAFQVPIALILAVRAGLTTRAALARSRRVALVAAFVAGAVLTPPDVVSQVLLAGVIMALYEGALACLPRAR